MPINRIKIYANDNDGCKEKEVVLAKKLITKGFSLVKENPDLNIAIGGDGAFLRMIKENKYNTSSFYVGINYGTLGFLQNISISEMDSFIQRLINEDFTIDEISIQETEFISNKEKKTIMSVNEIVVRKEGLEPVRLNVYIDDKFLEKYAGDGLLICTSTGSTAYNLSVGGSMVFQTFHTMQITPVAPLINSAYSNLTNSIIIPEDMKVRLEPNEKPENLLFQVDGKLEKYDNVEEINIVCKDKKIKCLRLNEHHYINTINDKFLRK